MEHSRSRRRGQTSPPFPSPPSFNARVRLAAPTFLPMAPRSRLRFPSMSRLQEGHLPEGTTGSPSERARCSEEAPFPSRPTPLNPALDHFDGIDRSPSRPSLTGLPGSPFGPTAALDLPAAPSPASFLPPAYSQFKKCIRQVRNGRRNRPVIPRAKASPLRRLPPVSPAPAHPAGAGLGNRQRNALHLNSKCCTSTQEPLHRNAKPLHFKARRVLHPQQPKRCTSTQRMLHLEARMIAPQLNECCTTTQETLHQCCTYISSKPLI